MKILKPFRVILALFLVWLVTRILLSGGSLPPDIKGNTEDGLRKVIAEQYRLLNQGKEGKQEICTRFIYSQADGVKKCLETNDPPNSFWKVDVHSVRVASDEGFVDRTMTLCTDASCSQVIAASRQTKRYIWINNTWKMDADKMLCPRDEPYEINPAFQRALSLVGQRLDEANPDYGVVVTDILNCLDIQYAPSESAVNGAEGYFTFKPGQSAERLLIYVSPSYKAKDDILTAILLSHEVTHAYNYAMNTLFMQQPLDCYADESLAFQYQTTFLYSLNQGEKQSLVSRYITGGSDGEVRTTLNLLMDFITNGKVDHNKTIKYVRSSPYYQQQCSK